MTPHRHNMEVPDLEMPGVTVVISAWFVPPGQDVYAGDRVVELLAGDVTVDLSAPVSGILAEQCVAEDEPVVVGQILAVIVAAGEEEEVAESV